MLGWERGGGGAFIRDGATNGGNTVCISSHGANRRKKFFFFCSFNLMTGVEPEQRETKSLYFSFETLLIPVLSVWTKWSCTLFVSLFSDKVYLLKWLVLYRIYSGLDLVTCSSMTLLQLLKGKFKFFFIGDWVAYYLFLGLVRFLKIFLVFR